MKTGVRLHSNKFPPYEGEQEKINPGLWGKRLAEYLVKRLNEIGIETGEIIAEDWGWYIEIKNEGFRLGLCCGHQDGDANEFLCMIDPATPIIRKWFRKINTTEQINRIMKSLETILSSDPDIKDVQWTEK